MEKTSFELTNPQKSIWLTNQMYKNMPIANICGSVIIEEKVNFVALQRAINLFVEQNDSFRMRFTENEGKITQYVTEFEPFKIEIIEVDSDAEVKQIEKNLVKNPFNITEELLFKFRMFEFPDGHGGFTINAHHLISDAWTAGLVVNEIVENYANILNKREIIKKNNSYIDYILSEKEYLQSERYQKDSEFWNEQFKEVPEIASIPSNNTDYSKSLCDASREQIVIEKELIERIGEFCRNNKISIFNFFMAIFAIYIGRVSSLEQFVIGTPILNRATFKEKNTTGMFISTVPFKVNLEDSYTFSYFTNRIASDTLGMLRHQKYPYNILLEKLREKDKTIPNLYDILISYQNVRSNRQTSEIPYNARWIFNETTSDGLDISLYDMNDTGSLDVAYDYQTAKYTVEDIKKMHGRILYLIEQALQNPEKLLTDFEIVTPEEKNKIIKAVNKTEVIYKTGTIIDLFHEQVEKTPNNTALIYKEEHITYKELENMANVVAEHLKSQDVYHQKVAVIANKSPKLIAALLGIMKGANSYVPIDPSYPKERIEYILNDCEANYVITQKEFVKLCSDKTPMLLENIDFSHYCELESLATEEDLAYLIYTSGTTGKPKGVEILQKNIINTLQWRKNYYPFDESIVTLQVPSYSFDSSVEDIFTSLIAGSTLVLPPSNKLDINLVVEEIEKNNINHFLVVPSLYKVLLAEKADSIRNFKFITIAGEGFGINLVKEHFRKLPNVRLINEYGPTENSVCSTYYELSEKDDRVLIGEPISNCHCYILDKSLHFLPEGVSGQLYVAGKGVSRGYLNKPEVTQSHFIKTPFSDEILYKTGDIVKLNNNYLLEFVGRNDGQVKLNGFRIELKEIDNVLLKYNGVKDAVTVTKQLQSGRSILVSYLIVSDEFEQKELENYLKQNLPHYMVPDIKILTAFPLTPNGKIDKAALPIPEGRLEFKHVLPCSELEKEILEVCQSVLKSEEIGVTDDLFKIGMADSLSILTISSKLFTKNIKIETQDFYKYTTVRELANLIENKKVVQKNHIDIVKPKYQTYESQFTTSGKEFKYKNILLTGVTGFLGAHLLYELLTKTTANVYCIIRNKNGQGANERLEDTVTYYFGKDFLANYESRINILEGELSENYLGLKEEAYKYIQNQIDCIIHSAATTKHYGNEKLFLN